MPTYMNVPKIKLETETRWGMRCPRNKIRFISKCCCHPPEFRPEAKENDLNSCIKEEGALSNACVKALIKAFESLLHFYLFSCLFSDITLKC